jgi:DNA-directed RNA polymerase subunit H (RpoH/RPB5)
MPGKAPTGSKRKQGPAKSVAESSSDDDDDDDDDHDDENYETDKKELKNGQGDDSEEDDVVAKLAASKVTDEADADVDNGGDDNGDEEVMAAKRRKQAKQVKQERKGAGSRGSTAKGKKSTDEKEKEKKSKSGTTAAKGGGGGGGGGGKKSVRLSAATLKTRMSPAMLQNPIARRKIWANLMQMMIRRGYEWVQDRPAPADYEELWPNNRGFLGIFHMHAADPNTKKEKREPVHVVFCSKAGEPTLKSLQYPSRHIILVSDSLTGRARGALQQLPTKTPPLASEPSCSSISATTTSTTTMSTPPMSTTAMATSMATSMATTATTTTSPTPMATLAVKDKKGDEKDVGNGFGLKDVFVEAFVSTSFMFDLLKQRYLKIVQFDGTPAAELEKVYEVFERKRDLAHFPRMLDTDPVVRHLRLPVGSVMKTTRLSTLAAVHNAYRVIVRTQHESKPS